MSINLKKLRTVARIDVEPLPEHIPVRGSALASGDDEADRAEEDRIISELEAGNPWAWCCVRVRARHAGLEGVDYLGACSYADEADFRAGGYFEDMLDRALAELAEELERAAEAAEEVSS